MLKLLILVLSYFFLIYKTNANSYELTVMSIHESKSITASNDYEFSISEANGNWQDNMGNYGKSRILFYIENEKDGKAYIKGLGQLNDQINNKFWFIPVRKSDQDAGVGKINFIDVPNKYNFLLNSNCNYAINYFENRSFFKVLCK
ncbi:hypothetical protein N9V56_02505 [Alphaproteobacteria bacterium]|nr:hypothetical protein [Alphaproteobacteria bacterium]